MTTMQPKKAERRTSCPAVLKRVMPMQYREKTAISQRRAIFCQPSQMRTLDSRSYFFMTWSTSIPAWGSSAAGAEWVFFRKLIGGSSLSQKLTLRRPDDSVPFH